MERSQGAPGTESTFVTGRNRKAVPSITSPIMPMQASLPTVPDLSDASGGLSNPAFFNFLSYILWKVRCQNPAMYSTSQLARL